MVQTNIGDHLMTEEEIERRVERMTDNLDRLFLRGAVSHKAYSTSMKELHQWAEAKYREAKQCTSA
jgi:hypothetical protein